MKDEAAYRGPGDIHTSQQDPDMAEIDRLIENSSLGTPEARSLRDRVPSEAVAPILYRASSLDHGPFSIGIEILPHELSGVVTDHQGLIHGHRRWQLPNMEVDTVVRHIAKIARDLAVTTLGLDLPHPAIGIGLQLGGPVDTKTGTVILYKNHPTDPSMLPPHLRWEWEMVKLAELVEKETGCRAVLENDASAFAARELKFGVGQEIGAYAVILIRDGVGQSMIMDHRLLTNPFEFGHLIVWPNGRTCECGLVGDIESQAGRRAIRAVACEQTGISADLDWEAAVEIAQGYGDLADKALVAFERAGEAIGRGIATLVTLLNPACVVIYAPGELIEPSGGSSRIADAFKNAVQEFRQNTFPRKRQCSLVTRPVHPTDGALGAALIALSRLFSVPLAPTTPNWSTSNDPAGSPTPRRESPSPSRWP
jgi:predicted NBD/HSP70 family sugar kinase